MTFLRWISCHLIVTIVVISSLVAWYYRDALVADYARLTGKEVVTPVAVHDKTEDQAVAAAVPDTTPVPASSSPWQTAEVSPDDEEKPGKPSIDAAKSRQDNFPADHSVNTEAQLVPGQHGMFPPPETTAPAFPEPASDSVFPGQQQAASQFALPAGNIAAETLPPEASPREPASGSMFPPDDYDPETGRVASAAQPGAGVIGMEAQQQDMPGVPAEPRFPEATAAHDSVPMQPQLQAQQNQPGYDMRLESARRLLWAGDLDKARHEYEGLMATDPSNPEVASELGNLLLQQDRIEEASQVYDAAIGNFRRQQRDNEAIGLIRFISRYNPALADSLYNKYWQ